ncbi:sigma-70 family RNA polymerase sigma factor [Phascolarctobacterium sp.]|uniref:sigma-70 family RNA polymerase sigma factor n=1 Tax=Phascolarctobacterium sp. TaxID=2049039 RepID=UPI0027D96E85|nr:sigma-70 family RNA polymerase sigma factor [uncultured Phascolarctobacterium sp.]
MTIKTGAKTAATTQPDNLKLLIAAAQGGDKQALVQLCDDFSPLLKSESRREMFYKSLGQDAEGIAVLAFIELVLKYNGQDFENWPGYARCKVHFALFDAMEKQGEVWENEITLATGNSAVTELLETAGLRKTGLDELAQLLLSLELQQALAQLTAEQRQVLELVFLRQRKPQEAAQILDCSVRNISKHRLNGLAKLRQLLSQEH